MQLRISSIIGNQLRKPGGPFGRFLMGRILNRENQRSHQLALQIIEELHPGKILEIGFGGGALLEAISAMGHVDIAGIDYSPEMVRNLRKKKGLRRFRRSLKEADAHSLPFEEAAFDLVIAVHVIYFWKDPGQVLNEVKRVLRSGGSFVLCMHSREKMIQDDACKNFTLYTSDEAMKLLKVAGFRNLDVRFFDQDKKADQQFIIGMK